LRIEDRIIALIAILDYQSSILSDDGKARHHGPRVYGEVVEVGSQVKKLKVGDRVVVAFPISCGARGAFKIENRFAVSSSPRGRATLRE
jgi:hypothetical protein